MSSESDTPESRPPDDASLLLPDGGTGRRPSERLPAGHLVTARTVLRPVADEIGSSRTDLKDFPRPAVCWLTDEPVPAGLWSHQRAAHRRCGPWPLLILDDIGDSAFGWFGEDESSLARLDPAILLSQWWKELGHGFLTRADRHALGLTKPEQPGHDNEDATWPGLAPPATSETDPDRLADEKAEAMIARHPAAKLALVAAARGADSLAFAGWAPTDDESHFAGALSAVVRTWEDRYGARVIGVGRGTLWLSVAAPPTTIEHAARIAAEHLPFCPEVEPREDFEYNPERPDFLQYAESIVDQTTWRFWWD